MSSEVTSTARRVIAPSRGLPQTIIRYMTIVLIFWLIIPTDEAEAAFLDWWSNTARIADRSQLIGEYLSKPTEIPLSFPVDDPPWATIDCRPYVNVALWRDANAFYDQIKDKMSTEKKDFEVILRKRVVVDPAASRRGQFAFPGPLANEVN
jgi:hypothetical protein